MFKFINLITSDNSRTITNLAIYEYVHKAFEIGNNEMYADNNTRFIIKRINELYCEF